VRTQIWIAISVYVLVAIIKRKLRLNVSLHTLLQILSLTLFEKLPLKQAVAGVEPIETNRCAINSSANAGSSWITRVMSAFAIRTITHSVTADTVTRRCGCPVILEGLDGMLQSHEATGKAATVARPHQLDREHDGDGASRLSQCESDGEMPPWPSAGRRQA
jgi:hypothetical protein